MNTTKIIKFNEAQDVDAIVKAILIEAGFDHSSAATARAFSDEAISPQLEYLVFTAEVSMKLRPYNVDAATIRCEYCNKTNRFPAYFLQMSPEMMLDKVGIAVGKLGGKIMDYA